MMLLPQITITTMCRSGDLSSYKGNCYLGIDAGSTTTKVALVGEDGTLLYSFLQTITTEVL